MFFIFDSMDTKYFLLGIAVIALMACTKDNQMVLNPKPVENQQSADEALDATGHAISFTFTTRATEKAAQAPNHALAVWIAKPTGEFVRTVAVYTRIEKQYLSRWQQDTKGNEVDAETGATLASHGTRTIVWNRKDTKKQLVPDGEYTLWLELNDHLAVSKTASSFNFTLKNTATNSTPLGSNSVFSNVSFKHEISSQ